MRFIGLPGTPSAIGVAGLLLLLTCRRGEVGGTLPPAEKTASPVDAPPVALNAVSPVRYPSALQAQGAEGTVLLRLFVDAKGEVHQDSTRIAESSGYPGLDSAALGAAAELRFAPALHGGAPVPTPFLQPIQFRASGAIAPEEATP